MANMKLLSTEPKSEGDLRGKLAAIAQAPKEYSIAVEALIFDADLNWVMMHRGRRARDEIDKYEGIGGRLEHDPDFRSALRREIGEEVGTDAQIRIVDFFEVKWDVVRQEKNGRTEVKNWIIVSYLCKHVGGALHIMEPEKCVGFVKISNFVVDPARLTSSAQKSLSTLKAEWETLRPKLVAVT